MRATIYAILAVFAMFFSGCGGGGGSTPVPPSGDVTQINIPPNSPATTTDLGSWTMTVPAQTFPAGASISIKKNEPEETPHTLVTVDGRSEITITTSSAPNGPIYIDVKEGRATGDIIYFLLTKTAEGWRKVAGGIVGVSRIVVEKDILAKRYLAHVVLGYVTHKTVSTESRLVVLAHSNNTEKYPFTMIVVPGLFENSQDMQLFANKVIAAGFYQEVVCFQYDYRQDIRISARALYDQISANRRWVNHDVWGHSAGAVVANYMFLKVGRPPNTFHFYSICGAHLGSHYANLGEFLDFLQNGWFNLDGVSGGPGIITAEMPIVSELTLSSAFLTNLNNTALPERCHISYTFVGGYQDDVVGVLSGLGDGIDFSNKIAECVYKYAIDCGHNDPVREAGGINYLLNTLFPTGQGYCSLGSSPYQTMVYNSGDSWQYPVILKNYGNSEATIIDLALDQYECDSNWIAPTMWFDFNAKKFDADYHPANLKISAGQSIIYTLSVPVNMALPVSDRPCTKLYLVRYLYAGRRWICYLTLSHVYDGTFPQDPKVRSRK